MNLGKGKKGDYMLFVIHAYGLYDILFFSIFHSLQTILQALFSTVDNSVYLTNLSEAIQGEFPFKMDP